MRVSEWQMNNEDILKKLDGFLDEQIENFEYIQGQVDDIAQYNHIDIKQISDLDRYFKMQKTIIENIMMIKRMSGI